MTEQEKRTAFARFEYLTLLKAGIKDWLINDEEEQKRLESMIRAIDKYCNLLADKINKENNQLNLIEEVIGITSVIKPDCRVETTYQIMPPGLQLVTAVTEPDHLLVLKQFIAPLGFGRPTWS